MTLKTAFTVCFAVVVTAVLVAFAFETRFAISVMLVATLVAVALDHVVSAFTRWGMRRSWALAAVVAGFLAIIAGVMLLVIPSLVEQGKALAEQAPEMFRKLKENRLLQTVEKSMGSASPGAHPEQQGQQLVQSAAQPMLAAVGGALSAATAFISILSCPSSAWSSAATW